MKQVEKHSNNCYVSVGSLIALNVSLKRLQWRYWDLWDCVDSSFKQDWQDWCKHNHTNLLSTTFTDQSVYCEKYNKTNVITHFAFNRGHSIHSFQLLKCIGISALIALLQQKLNLKRRADFYSLFHSLIHNVLGSRGKKLIPDLKSFWHGAIYNNKTMPWQKC